MKLIQMIRTIEDTKGGPVKADVHPDEVENYKKGGWIIEEKRQHTPVPSQEGIKGYVQEIRGSGK